MVFISYSSSYRCGSVSDNVPVARGLCKKNVMLSMDEMLDQNKLKLTLKKCTYHQPSAPFLQVGSLTPSKLLKIKIAITINKAECLFHTLAFKETNPRKKAFLAVLLKCQLTMYTGYWVWLRDLIERTICT